MKYFRCLTHVYALVFSWSLMTWGCAQGQAKPIRTESSLRHQLPSSSDSDPVHHQSACTDEIAENCCPLNHTMDLGEAWNFDGLGQLDELWGCDCDEDELQRAIQEEAQLLQTAYLENVKLRETSSVEPDEFGLPLEIEMKAGRSFRQLEKGLKRAKQKKGQARIVFYGASHVASDWFTDVIRTKLQSKYGDAGPGFVLPVRPWAYYRNLSVGMRLHPKKDDWETLKVRVNTREEDAYGLAGVAVETQKKTKTAELYTLEGTTTGTRVSSYEVFYLKQPRGGDFEIWIDGKKKKKVRTRSKRVRPGYQKINVKDGPHRFQIRTRGNGRVRLFGVALERKQPGVLVDTLGINGARARYHLLWEDSLYKSHLKKRKPDMVVVAYGTNECGDHVPIETYEEQLREVVGRIRKTVPQADCLLVGPSDRPIKHRIEIAESLHVEDTAEGEESNRGVAVNLESEEPDVSQVEIPDPVMIYEDRPRTREIVEVQRKVALEQGCGFFDLLAFQGGPMSTLQWAEHNPPYMSPDRIHYTRRGYKRIGEELLEAMVDKMRTLPKRRKRPKKE